MAMGDPAYHSLPKPCFIVVDYDTVRNETQRRQQGSGENKRADDIDTGGGRMCHERRRAEACEDKSAHHAPVNAGEREIV